MSFTTNVINKNSRLELLPLIYNSSRHESVLRSVMLNIPENVTPYIVGGAIRNALYRHFHDELLIQRDYDQVITAGTQEYASYLTDHGFTEHPYPGSPSDQTVYRKALVQGDIPEDYVNWIVFDMHTLDGVKIEDNINFNAGFTINGCVISGKDVLSKPWKESLIQVLPTALQDIKDKRLRVNLNGYKHQPSNFYAMLRFMSVGFSAPTPQEVQLLLAELPNLEHARFDRNVRKIWEYVGGEEKARQLVASLGISTDVFNEAAVKDIH